MVLFYLTTSTMYVSLIFSVQIICNSSFLHLPPRIYTAYINNTHAQSHTNLHSKDTGYSNCTSYSFQTKGRNFCVITVLQTNTVSCQQRCPYKLKKGRNKVQEFAKVLAQNTAQLEPYISKIKSTC